METPESLANAFRHIATPQNVFGSIAIGFGAFVGVLMKINNTEWMGWKKFLMLTVINFFFGFTAYLISLQYGLHGYWPVIIGLIFGSTGEKGGGWFMDNFKPVIIQTIFDYIEFARKKNLQ